MEYYEELTYALKQLSVVQSFIMPDDWKHTKKTAAAASTAMKIFSTPLVGTARSSGGFR